MDEELPSVTVGIPKPGEQLHSATLEIVTGKVLVELPAIALRQGKACRVVLQYQVGRPSGKPDPNAGSYYGIAGAAWKLGRGDPVKVTVELAEPPKGAVGVRLSLFTDVEACSVTPTEEAKLSIADNEITTP